jgi:hypothetical protein
MRLRLHVCLVGSLLVWAFVVMLAVCTVGAAEAQQIPLVTLSVFPDTVSLGAGEGASIIVTSRLPVTTVQAITLSTSSQPRLTLRPAEAVYRAPPRGDIAWTVQMTREVSGRATGLVFLRADYVIQEQDGSLTPGVVVTSLQVNERLPDPIDKIVTGSLETAADSLQEQRTRVVYVIIKNIGTTPVAVDKLEVKPPPDVTPTIQITLPKTIPPQGALSTPITLKVGNSVQPGKHLLLAQADMSWEQGGQTTTGSLVLTKEIGVSVFLEEPLAQAVQIPSLLLVPGFLALATFVFLIKARTGQPPFGLEFKSFEFIGFAIFLSLIIITLIYPFLALTQLLKWFGIEGPRNLIISYGFLDIVALWTLGLLLGVIAWVLVWGVGWERTRRREEKRRAATPTQDDEPLDVLDRLLLHKRAQPLAVVTYTPVPNGQFYRLPSADGNTWIAPRIEVKPLNGNSLQGLNLNPKTPKELITLISLLRQRREPPNPSLDLDWKTQGAVNGPITVDLGEIAATGSQDSFLEDATQ